MLLFGSLYRILNLESVLRLRLNVPRIIMNTQPDRRNPRVAQRTEREASNLGVAGSIPAARAISSS